MGTSRCSPLLLAVLTLSSAAHAQTTFETYRLSSIDETYGLAFASVSDVNEKGEMVGWTGSGPSGTGEPQRAILLRDGMVVELGDLTGGASPQTIALAINDLTQITGTSRVPDPSGITLGRHLAFLWVGGQIQDLGIDPNVNPRDINNRGQIVGVQSQAPPAAFTNEPFVWENGRITLLERLPCPSNSFGEAWAINENGVIAGRSTAAVGERAVVWRNGEVMVLLPTVPLLFGRAVDINDRDEAIGIYLTPAELEPEEIPEKVMSFLWHEGGVTVLPPLPLDIPFIQAHVQSINNEGQIVGFTRVNGDFTLPPPEWGSSLERATLWQEGAVVDLNDLISDDDPLKPFVALDVATAITDSGLILADGRDVRDFSRHSYLLTPSGASSTVASPSPSSSDTRSGGGAVDLLSILLLVLGLSCVARQTVWCQRATRATRFG